MNNIKIKLKWKLTLFTILIMTITSGILVFSINYDVRHTVPQLKGVINSNTGDVKIDLNRICYRGNNIKNLLAFNNNIYFSSNNWRYVHLFCSK